MYCTVDDLTQERTWGENFDGRQFEQAILDATDAIDIKLSGHYNVPFSPVPRAIRRLCILLAQCFLCQGNQVMTANDEELKSIKYLCDKAYDDLQHIASGKTDLGTQKKGTNRTLIYLGKTEYVYEEE